MPFGKAIKAIKAITLCNTPPLIPLVERDPAVLALRASVPDFYATNVHYHGVQSESGPMAAQNSANNFAAWVRSSR